MKSINLFFDSKEQVKKYGTHGEQKSLKNGAKSIHSVGLNPNMGKGEQKRQTAYQKAVKKLMNTFADECKIDQDVKDSYTRIKDLSLQSEEYRQQYNELQGKKEALKKEYGLSDDSEEVKKFEIYAKAKVYNQPLTDEEWDLYDTMGELTEYQQRCLDYEKKMAEFSHKMENNTDIIAMQRRAIDEVSVERLKSHAMVDAQKEEKDAVLDGMKDLANDLMQEVKENIDDKTVQEEEKEEKLKEEQKKKKEQMGIEQPDTGLDVSDIKNMTKSEQLQEEIQRKVKNMIQSSQITDEDVLGQQIDEKG